MVSVRSTHQRRRIVVIAIALVAAACSSTSGSQDPEPRAVPTDAVSIPNEGGTNEGHTPIGFPGTGTGLFVGDNLNSRFPDGDGVQTYMTFPLPDRTVVESAALESGLLKTSGSPFEDLGDLLVERVEYTTFGPGLFDLPAAGDPTACTVIGGTAVTCDVTQAVQEAVDQGRTSIQFRLRFEQIADNDSTQDLAMFYRTDSNTNEPGLFTLVINGDSASDV